MRKENLKSKKKKDNLGNSEKEQLRLQDYTIERQRKFCVIILGCWKRIRQKIWMKE